MLINIGRMAKAATSSVVSANLPYCDLLASPRTTIALITEIAPDALPCGLTDALGDHRVHLRFDGAEIRPTAWMPEGMFLLSCKSPESTDE